MITCKRVKRERREQALKVDRFVEVERASLFYESKFTFSIVFFSSINVVVKKHQVYGLVYTHLD